MAERYRPRVPLPELTAAMPPKLKPPIERYRPAEPKQPETPLVPAKPAAPSYVHILRAIMLSPPIRHRGEAEEVGLSVFEFAIGATAIRLAKKQRSNAAHEYGLRSGAKSMDAKRTSKHPVENIHLESADEQFIWQGTDGYERGKRRYNEKHAREDVTIKITRSALLRSSGLSRTTKNNRKVDAALTRLVRPIGKFAPILSHLQIRTTTLMLDVAYEWLPIKGGRKLSLPLPTSGPTTLALYLFLSAIDPDKGSIKVKELYRRLGIRASRPALAVRDLKRALKLVNEHRLGLELDTFEIEERRGGERLSFRATGTIQYLEGDDEGHDGDDGAAGEFSNVHRQTRAGRRSPHEVRHDAGDAGEEKNGTAPNDDETYLDDDEGDDEGDQRERRRQDRRRQGRAEPVDDSDAGIVAWCKAQGYRE